MRERLHGLLAFLGLVEEPNGFPTTPPSPRTYEEPVMGTSTREPEFVPRAAPRQTSTITFVDDQDRQIKPRPVPPIGNLRGAQHITNELDVEVFSPSSFNEASRITDQLKVSKTLLLNVTGMDDALRRRFIDYTSGTCYALGADIETLEKRAYYLIYPRGTQIAPAVRTALRARNIGR